MIYLLFFFVVKNKTMMTTNKIVEYKLFVLVFVWSVWLNETYNRAYDSSTCADNTTIIDDLGEMMTASVMMALV